MVNIPPSRRQASLSSLDQSLGVTGGIWIAAAFSGALCLFQLGLPLYSMQIFDRVLPGDSLPTLVTISLVMVGLTIASAAVDASRSIIFGRLAERVDQRLYRDASRIALSGSTDGLGALKDAETIKAFISSPLAPAVLDGPWSLAFILSIFLLHPLLGWLAIVASMLMLGAGFLSHAMTKSSRSAATTIASNGVNILNSARQTIDSSVGMGMQNRLLGRLLLVRHRGSLIGRAGAERHAWIEASTRGLRSLIQVAVLALAASLVLSHGLDTGAIVASSLLFSRALAPMERLGASYFALANFLSAWRRASTLIKYAEPVTECLELPPIEGHVTISEVSLKVAGRTQPILQKVNLTVEPGKMLVVVGREGAGKSTLARVLVGAVKPSSGVVRLDGSNLSDFQPDALGRQIGFAPEGILGFVGNVTDFICRYQRPDPAEVVTAAKRAGVHSVIQAMTSGYQTEVLEGSNLFSAGERKRLVLARAFYGSPRLIVLDEPTAHLDDSSETSFLTAIQEMKASGSTIIIISRLPGLLHLADQLVMLDDGVVRLAANQAQMQQFIAPRLASSKRL